MDRGMDPRMAQFAGLLALLGWMDGYRSVLINLGLPDDAIHISTVPRVKTPRGERVLLHGVDVTRLVYIDRIRKQLATAFKNLAEIDLLKVRSPLVTADKCTSTGQTGKQPVQSAAATRATSNR
jgi:hypothetical protein